MIEVLYEDDDLLVVNKPAGLVCHPTKGDSMSSLVARLRVHCGEAPVFLVNRLDRETSGVSVAAKRNGVAGELGTLFASRSIRKDYVGIVHGHPAKDAIAIDAPLGKDESSEVAIKDGVRADGAPALTRVRVARRFLRNGETFALMEIEPLSGRKHQIRIHLAHIGHPLVGDKIYGSDSGRYLRFVRGELTDEDRRALILEHHALHAMRLGFRWRERDWEFRAPPEPWFVAFLGSEWPGEAQNG